MRLYCAVFGVVALTIYASHVVDERPPDILAAPLHTIPKRLNIWAAHQDNQLTDRVREQLRADAYISRPYTNGSQVADVFIAYYAQQRAGETMHSPKHCLPGSGWEIWKHGSASVPFNGRRVDVNEFSIRHGARERMLMIYWYQSRQRIIASELQAKLLLVRDSLLDGRNSGAIVRIAVPDVPGASDSALSLAGALMSEVQRCMDPSSEVVD
jgi:EpsI family protein